MIARLIFSFCLTLLSITASAQKAAVSDSLWCDNLNNILRCVSMKQIYTPVGKSIKDSDYIAPFTPGVRLTQSPTELIGKQYNKVTYTADLYSAPDDKSIKTQYDKWYRKFKHCLYLWDEARLANRDKSIMAYQDYFFTNVEDETSVRMTIVHDHDYRVRITIY